MAAYSVLLVDDEEEVIDVIMKKIDWGALGFRVCGSAPNGVKALEMAEKDPPDVVMTDIRMPYMDGLELARRLKRDFPPIRVLLFTGFDEFEYAKEAVHLEVDEYILKPVNASELTEVFTRLRASLDQEREEKRDVERLRGYYMDSLPILQTSFLTLLIEGRIQEKDLARDLEDYRISLSGPYYCCVVFHASRHTAEGGINPLLLAMSVQQQARERLGEKWRALFFTYLDNTVMIVQMTGKERIPELTDDCDRFCKWALRILGAEVTAGIGPAADRPLGLSRSYGGAREAVSYRVLYGASRAINISEIAPQEQSYSGMGDGTEIRALLKSVHVGQEESIRKACGDYIAFLGRSARSVQQYRMAVLELVGSLYRFASGNYIDLDALAQLPGPLYETVPQMDRNALGEWLTSLALSVNAELSHARNRTSQSYVARARQYVRDHFDEEDLSLDRMCGELGVSGSYFSSIFKKETGESFISFLTSFRMREAARLLMETGEKNSAIARSVGYNDPNYFSYVFKKTYGMSPSRYRTEHRTQPEKTE